MKMESDFIEMKHREMALMKLQIQDELNKYKRECDGLREYAIRFSEEQKLAHDRTKRQEERYAKLLENFTKVENDKREVILQLKVSSTDLKSAEASKRRAEAEVEAWKKKFGELELRVFRLEQDTATLVIGDPLSKEKIDMDMKALDEDLGPVPDEIAGKKQTSCNGKSQNGIGFVNDSPNLAREKDHTLAAGLSMERNWRPESGAIIQINDCDDELPAVQGRTCVSNICDSGTILSQKKTNSQKSVEGAHFGQTGEENGGRGMQNHFLASTPKRKRDSSTDICDSENDDDYKFGKYKMKQLKDLICETKSYPINDSTTMPDSGGGCLSKFIPHGMDSSDSEDSSSSSRDTCSDSYMNDLIAKYERDNKTWTFEMDMLSAFERDPQLCMNAVCALYRQQTSTRKSIKGSLFSKKWGFNQFDVLRGTNLAKFLTDGDPQGKLKKSVSECKNMTQKVLTLDDCRKLATRHSRELFEIYQEKEDPFFFPS